MKKLITIAVAALLAVAAIIAVYRFGFRKSIPDAPVTEQVTAILTQNDCFVCHSQEPKLPFYFNFPVIGKMMEKHVDHATRFTDLASKDLQNPDEVTLAMLEHSITYGTMPIPQYKMIHWGTGFNKKEKALLADWILASRGSNGGITALPDAVEYDGAKAALGEKMYNDTRISLDGTISCATCHILAEGGDSKEGNRTSEGFTASSEA